ncbi:hypothetical protein ACX3YC_15860 [Pseudomonas mohnii]
MKTVLLLNYFRLKIGTCDFSSGIGESLLADFTDLIDSGAIVLADHVYVGMAHLLGNTLTSKF